ncbi:hypothetical protein TI39_contig307g00095 [Zymoseptoria brevis]|uniref:Uncharacterized protein n=1 Tax=Zymoseptoria brevis TaxID=1047168 RepID=A0A0F4GV13_9PEZI|nr:hypothetical protein TI39_contig307g00095 [Zymoseptoria brevis]
MTTTVQPYLPEEILQLVLQYVQDNEEEWPSKHTLAACCLVNRQCYRLAQPMLYHKIRIEGCYISTIKLLVRSLIYSPMLADHVRELCFGEDTPLLADLDSDGEELEDHGVEVEAIENYAEAVNASTSLSQEIRELIINGLAEGEHSANMAMLLIACQKLHVLEVELLPGWNELIVGSVLDSAGRDPSASSEFNEALPLSQLRELTVRCGQETAFLKMSELQWLIHIGQLETFRGDRLEIIQAAYEGAYGEPCYIKHLRLTDSACDGESLRELLACCSSLETLQLEFGPACLVCYGWVSRSIVEFGQNLGEICIDMSSLCDDPYDEGGVLQPGAPLEDMSELHNLQTLRLSAIAIYGKDDTDDRDFPNFEISVLTDILPTSLRVLEMFDCAKVQMEAMEKQLNAVWVDNRFEGLYRLRLRARGEEPEVTWGRGERSLESESRVSGW